VALVLNVAAHTLWKTKEEQGPSSMTTERYEGELKDSKAKGKAQRWAKYKYNN